MTKQQRRIALALFTCSQWWSDTGNGRGLLSLGTTYKIHSEEHRKQCLSDIDGDIAWNESWTGKPDENNDPKRDIPRLKDLRELVVNAKVDEPWTTHDKHNANVEILYEQGVL